MTYKNERISKKKQLTLHKVIYCKRFTENRLEYNP